MMLNTHIIMVAASLIGVQSAAYNLSGNKVWWQSPLDSPAPAPPPAPAPVAPATHSHQTAAVTNQQRVPWPLITRRRVNSCCCGRCQPYTPWVKPTDPPTMAPPPSPAVTPLDDYDYETTPSVEDNKASACLTVTCNFNAGQYENEDHGETTDERPLCGYYNRFAIVPEDSQFASITDVAVNNNGDIPYWTEGDNPPKSPDFDESLLNAGDEHHEYGLDDSEFDRVAYVEQVLRNIPERADVPERYIRNWVISSGKIGNSVTGIRRPVEGGMNNAYASAYVLPKQVAVMALKFDEPLRSDITFSFHGYAQTAGVALEVCCDQLCSNFNYFDPTVPLSSKSWMHNTFTCAEGTAYVGFHCHNESESNQGMCGVDEIECAGESNEKL